MIPLNRADIRPESAPLAIEMWARGANYAVVAHGCIVHVDPGGAHAWSEDDAEIMAAELGGVAVDLRADDRESCRACPELGGGAPVSDAPHTCGGDL